MRLGALRHAATLLTETVSDDGSGGQVVTWPSAVPDIPCGIEPMTGREFLQVGATQNGMGYRIRMRYRTDISAKSRLRLYPGGQTVEVLEVIDVNLRHELLEVAAIEVDA